MAIVKTPQQRAKQLDAARRQAAIEQKAGITAKISPTLTTVPIKATRQVLPPVAPVKKPGPVSPAKVGQFKTGVFRTSPESLAQQSVAPVAPVVPFKTGLTDIEKSSITSLVSSGRAFNETDAKNYAYATGQTNWQQFVGKIGGSLTGSAAPTAPAAPPAPTGPMATLVNKATGERIAVAVGSQEAREAFGRGFVLETSVSPAAPQPEGPAGPDGAPIDAPVPEAPLEVATARVEIPELAGSDIYQADPKSVLDFQALIDDQRKLQEAYLASLAPSDRESAIQAEIGDLRGRISTYTDAYQAGIDKISEEIIPMGFITGQQATLEKRAQRDLQTLSNIENNLLYELGLEKEASALQRQGLKDAVVFSAQNTQMLFAMQERIQANEDRVLARASTLRTDAKSTLALLLTNFKGVTIDQLSPEDQRSLANIAAQAGIPFSMLTQGMEVVSQQMAGELLSKRMETALKVQEKVDQRVDSLAKDFRGEETVKNFNQIANGYTFSKSINPNTQNPAEQIGLVYALAKAFDPNSVVREGEYATVQNNIQSYVKAFGKGVEQAFNGTGLLGSSAIIAMQAAIEKRYASFQDQYEDIRGAYAEQINGLTGGTDGEQFLLDYGSFVADNPTLDDIWEMSGGEPLTYGGGETLPRTGASLGVYKPITNDIFVDSLAAAIGQFESGGRYDAIGQVTSSGDRAYGKYQIMGANIPSWSRETLGRQVSIQEFLNSPQIQDQIATAKMGQSWARYQNPTDVASIWFTGRPYEQAGGSVSDVVGTSNDKYVTTVASLFNNFLEEYS